MVKLARILNRNAMDLNESFSNNNELTISFNLLDCVKTFKAIKELGIIVRLDPVLLKKYSRIMDCPYIEK